jgi:hypothetical protein
MPDETLVREILQRLTKIEGNTERLPKMESKFELLEDRLDIVCNCEAKNTEFRERWEGNSKWAWKVIFTSLITSLISLLFAIFVKGGGN